MDFYFHALASTKLECPSPIKYDTFTSFPDDGSKNTHFPSSLTNKPMKTIPCAISKFSCGALCLLAAALHSASAATLSSYTFNNDGSPLTATTTASGIVAGPVTLPGDFENSTSTDMVFFRSSLSADNLADAITGADYLQVTISAQSGQTWSLESFVFDHMSSNDQSPYTSNFSVFASFDGFTTAPIAANALATSTGTASTSGSDPVLVNDNFSVSLTAPAFQNLDSSTTVTFRIYGFDDGNSSGAINRIDNIFINGVIPEPSSLLLVSGSCLIAAFRRRR